MGEKISDVERADKDKTGNRIGKKGKRREGRSTNDGEGTTDKSRVDSATKKNIRTGSWNVCGFATEERKRLEIIEQVSKRDL